MAFVGSAFDEVVHNVPPVFSVALCGEVAVGKTTFLVKHTTGEFVTTHDATCEAIVRPLIFYTNLGSLSFNVWDSLGGFRLLRDTFHAVIVMYCERDLLKLHQWKRGVVGLYGRIPMVFVRSKCDVSVIDESWPVAAMDVLQFQSTRDVRARSALLTACLCLKACGACRDVRSIIAEYVWHSRFSKVWDTSDQQIDETIFHVEISTKTWHECETPFLYLARILTQRHELEFSEYPILGHPPEVEITPELLAQYERELAEAREFPLPDFDDDF